MPKKRNLAPVSIEHLATRSAGKKMRETHVLKVLGDIPR